MPITVPIAGTKLSVSTFGNPVATQLNNLGDGTRKDFHARKTTVVHVPTGVETNVSFDTTVFNNLGGTWNGTTYTFNQAGNYLLTYALGLTAGVTARSFVGITMGGTNTTPIVRGGFPTGEDLVGTSACLRFASGDSVSVRLYTLMAAGADVASGTFTITRIPGV